MQRTLIFWILERQGWHMQNIKCFSQRCLDALTTRYPKVDVAVSQRLSLRKSTEKAPYHRYLYTAAQSGFSSSIS